MNLTAQQQAVVDGEGDFLLLACPGSGKTRSAAERVARLARTPGTKVAVCSYTNVGAERIGAVLTGEVGTLLDRQHFLGTIHKFLLRYVVHPYAHLLGATRGPRIHEGGGWPQVVVNGDNAQRIELDAFRRHADGTQIVVRKPRTVQGTEAEIIASVGEEVLRRKGAIFRRGGVLSADDAMWIALCVLRTYPNIAAAVAGRFDELLLDEAQDTSELQLACLDELHATGGLGSLVLVGDLEQSIFSFQGASAARCQQLADDRDLRVESMTENHRSSQRICNAAVHFCSRDTPDVAVGPHADCDIAPEIVLYPAKDPAAAMDVYRARLRVHGLSTERATVLARRWKVVDALNGQTSLFDNDDRRYIVGQTAAHLAAGTLTAKDIRGAQRVLAYCAWGETHVDQLTDEQHVALRHAGHRLLQQLPALAGDLRSWLVAARQQVHELAVSLRPDVAHTGGRALRAGPDLEEHSAAEVFAPPARDLHARTVHSFKGDDNDAVMVVIHRPHASDPTSQLELWEAAVAGADMDPERAEEQRVLFVALTRARRYCLVAVPDTPRGRQVAASCGILDFVTITT